jgi:hypothetical protein
MYRTLEQVASDLHVTPRKLRETIRTHRIAVLKIGRTINFDDVALRQLEDALREEALKCHSSAPPVSGSPSVKTPARSRSSARSPGSAYVNALSRATSGSQRKKPASSKPRSCEPNGTANPANVVVLDPSAKPPKAT